MATGQTERAVVSDANAPNNGTPQAQQLAVQGIMSSRGAPAPDNSLDGALAALTSIGSSMDRKAQNADLIEGQLASAAGKTQTEVAATGNSTTMAGFVGLEVGNAVSEWSQTQIQEASINHYNTTPEAYRDHLSKSAAGLIAAMGGDDFAEETLMGSLAPAMERLGVAQATAHTQWTQGETANAYTNSLMLSGQYAASDYEGSTTANGAVEASGDYRAFAASISNQIVGVESGNNPNAANPDSSAEGLGQFIDSTWLATIRRYKPELAAGKSNAELLGMKRNGPLSRELSIEYTAEQARGLAAAGLPVTPGTTYLSYFAGNGGARRILRGDPTAPVSTTMTPGQIRANHAVTHVNGRLKTNAEMVQWAEGKMGGASSANRQVQSAVLTNPGLPPAAHRTAVVQALVASMEADDGSLFQNVGGIAGLSELNLSVGQLAQVQSAQRNFQDRRQNDYNMDYERAQHDILTEAASGEFTEDEMFDKLTEMNVQFDRSDVEMRRVHTAMQGIITNEGQADALGVWSEPDRQLDLIEIKNGVLDGRMTAEEAMQEVLDVGYMHGASTEATEAAVQTIMGAYDKVRNDQRSTVAATTRGGAKAKATSDAAAALISRNVLGTGSKEEQATGVLLLEQRLADQLIAQGTLTEDVPAIASEMMAKVLVQNDVIDTTRASMMRAAFHNPIGLDGKPTPDAVEALGFFMDLKETAGATPEYLTRMFAGNAKTLEMLYTAEEHMVGEAHLDVAVARAWEQVNNPVTAARIAEANTALDNGSMQTAVRESILAASGVEASTWNNVFNLLNPDWHSERLDPAGREMILSDAGLDAVIESETRSAISMNPNASMSTITQVVAGQMAERGAVMGSSFVMAPLESNMRDVLGLNSTDKTAPNTAVLAYMEAHGEEAFGPAVWADIGPGLTAWRVGRAAGAILGGENIWEASRSTGITRPEYTVERVQGLLTIRIVDAAFRDDPLFDNFSSLPETAVMTVAAKDVGAFYNAQQAAPKTGFSNSIADFFRRDPATSHSAAARAQAEQAISDQRDAEFGTAEEEETRLLEDAILNQRLADAPE